MDKQIYYEDIELGAEIPLLVKELNFPQLIMWAGVSGDYNMPHYDKDLARSRGLPDVIVNGPLIFAFFGQALTNWIGDGGDLVKLSCNYRHPSFPGTKLTIKGSVKEKRVNGNQNLVILELWAEDDKANRNVVGTASVRLPLKKG